MSCWALGQPPGDTFLSVSSLSAEQASLQQDPEKHPSRQGFFKAAVVCVEERGKTRSPCVGLGQLMGRGWGGGEGGLESKSYIFRLESFKVKEPFLRL